MEDLNLEMWLLDWDSDQDIGCEEEKGRERFLNASVCCLAPRFLWFNFITRGRAILLSSLSSFLPFLTQFQFDIGGTEMKKERFYFTKTFHLFSCEVCSWCFRVIHRRRPEVFMCT